MNKEGYTSSNIDIRGDMGCTVQILISGYQHCAPMHRLDANWLTGTVNVKVVKFYGSVDTFFHIDALKKLKQNIEEALSSSKAIITFGSSDGLFSIAIEAKKTGVVLISGIIEDHDVHGSLRFSFDSDLSFLNYANIELESILSMYPEQFLSTD